MTDVHFYFNVPDKLHFACRLARKAFMQQTPLLLSAAPQQLQQLDAMLWQMAPADFVAHDWLDAPPGQASAAAAPAAPGVQAPILLCERIDPQALHGRVHALLSLWDEVPAGFSHFEHLYELVSPDAHDRQRARQRWRHYQQRGYAILSHDLGQAAAGA
ncbi:DNA polymerase III subunit chi [Vandammella animalimorsus]|uniref:DNA polymerase III subunit chi n=1 Tax=Vandammella animalimorsus TaxID=2029117 RepID=A0A2A2AK10_9BURK|nr:DNA polymerase III subunit chi [Vandammella animalimorsus]PAT38071.1 DNA polymerase III subunit chi [Vandammella animalimorsus]